MRISDEQLTAFRSLYRERFGLDLTVEEALEQAQRLIRLFEIVAQTAVQDTKTSGTG